MHRILAHHIIFSGKDHGLSVAEFADDYSSVSVRPFCGETHSTQWVDGIVEISEDDKGLYQWRKIDKIDASKFGC